MSERRLVGVLVAGMALVVACFLSAIVYFELSTMHVRQEARAMLENGVPSAERLTGARTALRELDGALDQALLLIMEKRPADRRPIDEARARLNADVARYRTLPFYVSEAELNRALDDELAKLDATLYQLDALLGDGQVQAAHVLANGEWRRQSDRVDDAIRELIALNVENVTGHALRIDRDRWRAAVVGLTVGALALILAFVATLAAVRAVRREARLQTERVAELEMFSARVAHDVTSPLASVSLGLDLARTQVQDERLHGMMTRSMSALKRVRSIVDDLLQFARTGGRPETGAPAPVAVVVSSICDELRPRADDQRIELACDVQDGVHVACSTGILTVLITNLVNNAIKFMGDAPTRLIRIVARDQGGIVRVTVEDSGPGLPAGFGEKAFQPYARGRADVPGLGLGLATVKRLVEAHGGRVGVEPRQDGGAIFWFELPRAEPVVAAAS